MVTEGGMTSWVWWVYNEFNYLCRPFLMWACCDVDIKVGSSCIVDQLNFDSWIINEVMWLWLFTCDDFVLVELCAIIIIKQPIRPGTDTETYSFEYFWLRIFDCIHEGCKNFGLRWFRLTSEDIPTIMPNETLEKVEQVICMHQYFWIQQAQLSNWPGGWNLGTTLSWQSKQCDLCVIRLSAILGRWLCMSRKGGTRGWMGSPKGWNTAWPLGMAECDPVYSVEHESPRELYLDR